MAENSLSGKVAIVTGGGRGIGRAIALGLAQAGADVTVIGRAEKPLEEVAREIEGLGRRALSLPADLRRVGKISGLFEEVTSALGGLDILVNSAGVQLTGPSTDVTEETWDETLDANAKALFFCCQSAGRHFLAQGRGKIINLASTFSLVGFPGFAAYCASKGAVLQITRALAVEWASQGVNVNAIGPTAVRTEMNAYLFDDPAFREAFLPRVPAGRILEPKDVVGAAVFLAGPGSDMMHGSLLLVDAGYTSI